MTDVKIDEPRNKDTETLRVIVVTTMDDFMACNAVRSAAFLARGEPYFEEFDGNDLVSTTHLLAKCGKAPIGTMRVRILNAGAGGIAAWERLAILPNAGRHGTKALLGLARTARAYSEFKGVGSVVGAVENPKLLKFWQKHGFELMNVPPAVYNNVEYRQIRLNLRDPQTEPAESDDYDLVEALNGSVEYLDFDRYLSQHTGW